jgi:hypothetical protein
MRSAIFLSSVVILTLLLSLQVTPPTASQTKKQVEDEAAEIRERLLFFYELHRTLVH